MSDGEARDLLQRKRMLLWPTKAGSERTDRRCASQGPIDPSSRRSDAPQADWIGLRRARRRPERTDAAAGRLHRLAAREMQRSERLGRCHYRSVTSGDAGDPPGDPGGGARGRARRTRRAPQLPGGVHPPRGRRHVRGPDVGREGPGQGHPHRRGRHPGAGPRRGLRRRDGQLDQLQHGVDLDLRAGADVRLPRPLRPGGRVGASATPSTTRWSARTPRASCSPSAPPCGTGSPATG